MKIRETVVAELMEEVVEDFADEFEEVEEEIAENNDDAYDYDPKPITNYGFADEVQFEYLGYAGKYSFLLGTRPNGRQFVIWLNNINGDVDQVDGVEFLQVLVPNDEFVARYGWEYEREMSGR